MKNGTSYSVIVASVLVALSGIGAIYAQAQDKYSLKVPGGLAFSEFKGYESWQTIAISENGPLVAVIVGNPQMIEAFEAGIPANEDFNGARQEGVGYYQTTTTNRRRWSAARAYLGAAKGAGPT